MEHVMTCRCGQGFRVPTEHLGRAVRCPGCGAAVETSRWAARAPIVGDPPAQSGRSRAPRGLFFIVAIAAVAGPAAWSFLGPGGPAARARVAQLLGLGGPVESDAYGRLMERGRSAVADAQYDRALAAFASARDLCRAAEPRWAEADRAIREATRARLDDYAARMARGRAALASRRCDEAEAAFLEARGLFEGQLDSEQQSQAEAALRELPGHRNRFAAYDREVHAGDEARGREDFPAALAAYGRADALAPGDPTLAAKVAATTRARDQLVATLVARGRAAVDRRDWDGAVAQLDRALGLGGDPGDARALRDAAIRGHFAERLERGRLALEARRHAEAVADLERACELVPDDPPAVALLHEARYREAIEAAKCGLSLARYDDALARAERALKLRPDDGRATRWRDEARMALDPESLPEVRRFVEVEPDDPVAGEPAADRPVPIAGLAFHADGRRLVVVDGGGRVRAFDLEAPPGTPGSTWLEARPDRPVAVALARDGSRVALAQASGRIAIHSLDPVAAPTVVGPIGSSVRALAFSPDGRLLVAGTAAGSIIAWEADKRFGVRFQIEGPTRPVAITALAVSHDGTRLAAGPERGNIRLYDTRRGETSCTLDDAGTEHPFPVTGLAFSPDGQTLVSGRSHGWVSGWEVVGATKREWVQAHLGAVAALAFSADRRSFASVSADGTASLVRSVERGGRLDRREGPPLRLHRVAITAAAFHPRTGQLATGDAEGCVKLWGAAPRE